MNRESCGNTDITHHPVPYMYRALHEGNEADFTRPGVL